MLVDPFLEMCSRNLANSANDNLSLIISFVRQAAGE